MAQESVTDSKTADVVRKLTDDIRTYVDKGESDSALTVAKQLVLELAGAARENTKVAFIDFSGVGDREFIPIAKGIDQLWSFVDLRVTRDTARSAQEGPTYVPAPLASGVTAEQVRKTITELGGVVEFRDDIS